MFRNTRQYRGGLKIAIPQTDSRGKGVITRYECRMYRRKDTESGFVSTAISKAPSAGRSFKIRLSITVGVTLSGAKRQRFSIVLPTDANTSISARDIGLSKHMFPSRHPNLLSASTLLSAAPKILQFGVSPIGGFDEILKCQPLT